jgi:hypothetical protein
MNDLPEENSREFEAGLAFHHRMKAERDELRRHLDNAKVDMAKLRAEIDTLEQARNLFDSRVQSLQLERDQAVANRAIYETLFVAFKKLIDAFKIPAAPLVHERPHDPDVQEAMDNYHERTVRNATTDYDVGLAQLASKIQRGVLNQNSGQG